MPSPLPPLLSYCCHPLQAFENEYQVNEQCLTTLNNLSHELITQYHKEDDTADLKEAMADLNQRWKTMTER